MRIGGFIIVLFANFLISCMPNNHTNKDDNVRGALSDWAVQIPDVIDTLDGSPEFSQAYSAQFIPNRTGREEKEELFRKFIHSQNEFGLRPVRIIIESSGFPTNYWTVDFDGCDPGACENTLREYVFFETDRKDWVKHKRGNVRSKVVPIDNLVFEDTVYNVFLNFRFDGDGDILAAEIYAQREAESNLEAARVSITSGGHADMVTVYSDRRILARSK